MNNSAWQTAVINWNLTQTSPVVTAEAGTMELLLIGLACLTLIALRKTQN